MANYKEILRLHSLGINNTRIAESCGCARSTVISTLQRADTLGINWSNIQGLSEQDVSKKLYPRTTEGRQYRMPDYEQIHKEMQKSGVTLSLLWVEYCEQCRAVGELPYQSTQFNKYYADYVHKTKATMHLNHKPGETMQVDWAGDAMGIVDTDTGELIPAYLFVSVLPYSGYAYAEAFLDEKQEAWINAHVNAYRFYSGVTRILVPDNLKTGVIKNTKNETVLNRSYREMAEHYGTAVIPARPRTPKDKAFVEGSVTSIDQYYGTQSKCCPHYVGVHEGDEVVCLTEGVMKADIAYSFALGTSYESGFVGLTGVPSYSQFARALEELNSIGVVRINIMVDSDYQVKEEVRKARDRYIEMGVAAGFEVAPITWTQKRKGVDDLYKHLFRNK